MPHVKDAMSGCLTTGDADLGHLVKVVSAKFLHCKVTVHFELISYLGVISFMTMQILPLFKLWLSNFITRG